MKRKLASNLLYFLARDHIPANKLKQVVTTANAAWRDSEFEFDLPHIAHFADELACLLTAKNEDVPEIPFESGNPPFQRLLDIIRAHEPISEKELAAYSGYSEEVIKLVANELIKTTPVVRINTGDLGIKEQIETGPCFPGWK